MGATAEVALLLLVAIGLQWVSWPETSFATEGHPGFWKKNCKQTPQKYSAWMKLEEENPTTWAETPHCKAEAFPWCIRVEITWDEAAKVPLL